MDQRSRRNRLTRMKNLRTVLIALAAGSASLAADVDISKLPPASTKSGVTYAADIKPIFEKSCFKCHGEQKQKGKLRVDSLQAVLKGGENAPNVIKGDSAKSTLVHAVARLNSDEAMPPDGKGDPLSKEQIGLIRAWIDQGAK
jgi:mono/diheme cytochrome c family protein